MSEFRMRSVVQGRARDPDPVRLPPVRVGAAAQPSSVIPGRPSAAEEDCAFSREEVEVHATYIRSGMSRDEGDHMLRWARNEAYRSRHIRFGSMRALCTAISKAYAPEGVSSVNFHEPKDGKQHVVLYHRSLLGSLKRVLANPRYAGIQYNSFRCLTTEDGVRVYGAFNNGDWYEFAHAKAQTLGGGQPVSVVPYFMGSDATVARKNMSMYPFFACPGCLGDDVRSEPGAWVLVAVLPHYSIKAAKRAGRAEQGPAGYRRRKVHTLCILHAHCAHLAHFFTWCARSLDGVHGVLKVLSKFVQSVQSSQKVCSTAGGRCPAVACAHRVHTGNTWCTHMILFVHTMHTLCTFRAKVCS